MRKVFSVFVLAALAAGIAVYSQSAATTSAPASASQPEGATILPLKRGYYVAQDTPCAEASNATVTLLQRQGMGGARDFCTFEEITKISADMYRVAQACADFQDGAAPEHIVSTYTLTGDTQFVSRREDGWEHRARYCAQSDMPPDFRDNDISEVTGE